MCHFPISAVSYPASRSRLWESWQVVRSAGSGCPYTMGVSVSAGQDAGPARRAEGIVTKAFLKRLLPRNPVHVRGANEGCPAHSWRRTGGHRRMNRMFGRLSCAHPGAQNRQGRRRLQSNPRREKPIRLIETLHVALSPCWRAYRDPRGILRRRCPEFIPIMGWVGANSQPTTSFQGTTTVTSFRPLALLFVPAGVRAADEKVTPPVTSRCTTVTAAVTLGRVFLGTGALGRQASRGALVHDGAVSTVRAAPRRVVG